MSGPLRWGRRRAVLAGVTVPDEVTRRLVQRDRAVAAAAEARGRSDAERRARRLVQGVRRTRLGARGLASGRLWHRMRLQAHTAPSRMLKALYPWIMDPGLGVPGADVGQDLFSQASFLFDPFELYAAGVISSPNMALVGEIGAGKSALMKSLILRLSVFGIAFSWVQVKPEYEQLAAALGVVPVRLGPGQLVRLNPLAEVRRHPDQTEAEHRAANRSRRLALLEGALQVTVRRPLRPADRAVVGWALDAATGADGHGTRLAPVSLPALLAQLIDSRLWAHRAKANGAIVVGVAFARGLGEAGAQIGIAAALAETDLYNYANDGTSTLRGAAEGWPLTAAERDIARQSLAYPHDRVGRNLDSIGLFQQRPMSGWGSPGELIDPATAAGKFFDRMIQVPDWRTRPPWTVAQAVQGSPLDGPRPPTPHDRPAQADAFLR